MSLVKFSISIKKRVKFGLPLNNFVLKVTRFEIFTSKEILYLIFICLTDFSVCVLTDQRTEGRKQHCIRVEKYLQVSIDQIWSDYSTFMKDLIT